MFTQRSVPCLPCHSTGRQYPVECALCQGRGSVSEQRVELVRVPVGSAGEAVRVRGVGDYAVGDLVVQVVLEDHQRYRRSGGGDVVVEDEI